MQQDHSMYGQIKKQDQEVVLETVIHATYDVYEQDEICPSSRC